MSSFENLEALDRAERHAIWPTQCDIRGCAGVAVKRFWTGPQAFVVFCEKHSRLEPELSKVEGEQ